MPTRLNEILFVELLGGIGDLVMALPSIHGLALSHPQARVSVFSFSPGVALLVGDANIARIYSATKGDDENGQPLAKRQLANLLSSRTFDLVVCDARYGGLDELIESCEVQNTVTRLWNSAGQEERIERVLLRNLIEAGWVNAEIANDIPHLPLSSGERILASSWWTVNAPAFEQVAVLYPDTGMPVKRWPAEYFIIAGQALRDHDIQPCLASGDDAATTRYIAEAIGEDTPILPKMPLRQFAGVVAESSLFISADTGPTRVAAAVGVPTVALFGPTWKGRYGLPSPHVNLQSSFQCQHLTPMNFTTQPCWYSGRCAYPEKRSCMEDITPQDVIDAALRLLRSAPTA